MTPPRRVSEPDPYERALRDFLAAQRAWRAAQSEPAAAPARAPEAWNAYESARRRLAHMESRRRAEPLAEKAWGGH